MRPADACVIDLDGTLYHGGRAIVGAADAVRALHAAGVPFCFATNTTRKPRRALVDRLAAMDIEVEPQRLFTAPRAAARWLRRNGLGRVMLLLAEASHEEFADLELTDQDAEAVVVGDLGREFSYDRLNSAFVAVNGGARLVAIQKNRWWDDGHGPRLDAGPFVAALEFACACTAVVVGKPSRAFFETAAETLDTRLERIAVVGDSLANDVAGGQAAGCLGVAVRTGTFHRDQLAGGKFRPDAVLESIADLPRWLEL